MGIFSFLFRSVTRSAKYGLYTGSIYTFFGYFYAQQIKHRLGDDQHCQKVAREQFVKQLDQQVQELPVAMALAVMNVFTFYVRTWLYREFEQDCKEFHRMVIKSILKNYEEYGIFEQKAEMEAQVARGEVNPTLLSKILQVKELNLQLLSLYGEKYFAIVRNQLNLRTGAIIGLTPEEKEKIELVSAYIEKGERLIFKNEDKYWEYKLMQSEARKHGFGDTIFKIIFI